MPFRITTKKGRKFMAQKVQVLLVDDIDGSDADETVTFSLDGVSYEIDLTDANAQKLRDDLSTWIGHARRAGGRKTTSRSTTARRASNAQGAGESGLGRLIEVHALSNAGDAAVMVGLAGTLFVILRQVF